jgi:hypothetical protein
MSAPLNISNMGFFESWLDQKLVWLDQAHCRHSLSILWNIWFDLILQIRRSDHSTDIRQEAQSGSIEFCLPILEGGAMQKSIAQFPHYVEDPPHALYGLFPDQVTPKWCWALGFSLAECVMWWLPAALVLTRLQYCTVVCAERIGTLCQFWFFWLLSAPFQYVWCW